MPLGLVEIRRPDGTREELSGEMALWRNGLRLRAAGAAGSERVGLDVWYIEAGDRNADDPTRLIGVLLPLPEARLQIEDIRSGRVPPWMTDEAATFELNGMTEGEATGAFSTDEIDGVFRVAAHNLDEEAFRCDEQLWTSLAPTFCCGRDTVFDCDIAHVSGER
jgi:hypothetical protein